MSLAIKLLKERRTADQHLILSVVVAWHFTREVTVSEPDLEFIGVLEACSNDLNHSVTLAWTTLGIDLIHSDGSIEQTSIAASLDIGEDALISASVTLALFCSSPIAMKYIHSGVVPWEACVAEDTQVFTTYET